ncbi:MAG: rRNA maturation RNase YbeY [Methylobacteriaceae bacterium]|nr:rRNA maturation RNase YbeY [Methylobacteriaceae bacterium]
MIVLDILAEAGDWPADGTVEEAAERAAAAAAAVAKLGTEPVAATLLLTDDSAIRTLNRTWRGKDKATNVLSFPADAPVPDGEPRHLGDIALAHETVAAEAAAEGKSLEAHVAHLVVHGVLHLLGRDHGTASEADAMEALEVEALGRLGIGDPYRDTDPLPQT